jgi:RNA-directed DNA polymerase
VGEGEGQQGARTAGVDRVVPAFVADDADIVAFLTNTREQLNDREELQPPARRTGWADPI